MLAVAGAAAFFEIAEDFARAADDRRRDSRQFGDVDAVTAVGAAAHDLPEENDRIPFFQHVHP
ncbi:MAG: hypothetical protein R2843_01765 [Thermomicrobiales bacterium]